ncbi:MAG: hypothetical protein EOM84_02130 [Sphingobacteriia bacterium]|nr:hypothetical protein [Sphingobacteriia bacterium]
MKKIEIIILKNENEYRIFYEENFVDKDFFLGDISVSFSKEDFNHIFFEPNQENGRNFSSRRAKRMLFIKEILSGDLNIELMYQEDRGTFAIFCFDLECVVYLRSRTGSGKLQIGTFFDFGKKHKEMYLKQKKKCIEITLQGIKDKL